MLRHAARLLTERVRQKRYAWPTFVAFALDDQLEQDSLARILKECGADPGVLQAWRKSGLLAPTACRL